jgi:vacuolar-type H+-ATPase subunit E/Vma4
MALEDIFRALDQQADDEVEQMLQEARDHADVIAADADEQAEAIRIAHVNEVERITRAHASQKVNAARLDARKRIAAVKQTAVDKAFDAAQSKLKAARSQSGYPDVFAALLKEALTGVDGDFTVEVDPADAELARKSLAATGLTAEVRSDLSASGGVVVETQGARVVRRNTLEDRLQRVRELDQAAVAGHLFS